MNKVLLATTALVASTTFAMADGHAVWSGSASAGIASGADTSTTDDNDGEMHVWNEAKVTITLSGASDNGLEFGTSLSAEAGNTYDTGDFEFDGVEGGEFTGASVWISGGGVTLTLDDGDIDDLENDDNSHDLQLDFAAGDLSMSVTYDVDGDNAGSEASVSVGYSAGDLGITVTANDADESSIALSYALGDISLGLDHDMGAEVTEVSAGFSAGDVGIDVSADTDDNWDISASFSSGNTSVSVSTDESDAWEITGSMDAGGGLSLNAGFNADNAMYLGAAMSF